MKNKDSILKIILNLAKATVLPIAMYLIMMILLPDKILLKNFSYILIQAVLPAVLAWGVTFNLTAGHSDFSVGAAVLFASIVGGNIALKFNMGVLGLLLFCPIFGMLSSGLTGGLYVTLRVPSMIVSLGVMLIMESVCSLIYGGSGVALPLNYIIFGSSSSTLVFGLVAFAIAYYLFNYRVFGTHVRALGSNANVARQSGLNVPFLRFKCFLCVGFFAGLYAVLSLGTSGIAQPVTPMGTMRAAFNAIMGYMVGTAIAKSVNVIVSVYIGAVFMQMLNLFLTAINFPSLFSQSVVACVVLVVMCHSTIREQQELRKQHRMAFEAAVKDA